MPRPDSSVVERGPEKAGVGGSIPSLATTSKSIICRRNFETASDLQESRPQTQTVSVYTRHTSNCSKKSDPHWKRCKWVKYLYLLQDGKNKTISAKTRSWEKAEDQAQEIRDSWDPVKQKLRELGELQQAKELGEITITYALDRWLTTVKTDSDSANEHTHSKYQTAAKQIGLGLAGINSFALARLLRTSLTSGRATGPRKLSITTTALAKRQRAGELKRSRVSLTTA